MHLTTLQRKLGENSETYLFPCIIDLVTNGLCLERFNSDDRTPSRQDITQYLGAWSRYAGLSADESREWMIDYATDRLSAISSSSRSQIRHSTKGNIKYIYNSEVTFACRCENNQFKASCNSTCLIYEEMTLKAKEEAILRARTAQIESEVESYETKTDDRTDLEVEPIKSSIKEEYKDQFEKALSIAKEQWKKSIPHSKIVSGLNASGFKTRTGKNWSTSTLVRELKKLRETPK